MCQHQGQEKPINKHSDCHKEQNISADETTHSPASNKANGKAESEENETKTETSKKDGTGTEIQQNIATYPVPEPVPEKSISPDTHGNPGSSNAINKPPHTSSSPDGYSPQTLKTLEQEPTSPAEG